MLDDHDRGPLECAHGAPRGIEIEQVIVRQFFAAQQLAPQWTGVHAQRVQPCRLVRVLAVAQVLNPGQAQREQRRHLVWNLLLALELTREVSVNRGIVAARERKRLHCQPAARGLVHLARCLQHLQHRRIIHRIGDDGHAGEILGRCPHQRHPADIDLLDGFVQRHTRLVDRRLKRVKIAHHQVNRRIAFAGQRGHVFLGIARQNRRVHGGMQRLDPPGQHLRRARHPLHRRDRQPGQLQGASRPPAGDQVPAQIDQPAGECFQPGLVINAQNGARHDQYSPFMRWQ